MLEVSGLSRSYGELTVVDDVGFAMKKGEIVGLLGHNGAGKTTIMRMLSGYLEPDQGSIKIDGAELGESLKAAQQSLGYLPENVPLYPEMTVADYLDYAADLKGLEGDLKRAELSRVIRATDLSEKLLASIATLSRGYKQRVGVAQAILGKPRLLILDEPTNGLDPVQTEQMRSLIKDIAQDATVIISTHIMQEVDAVCERVLIIKNGRLVVDERLTELKVARQLELATSLAEAKLREILGDAEGLEQITPLVPAGTVPEEPASMEGQDQIAPAADSASKDDAFRADEAASGNSADSTDGAEIFAYRLALAPTASLHQVADAVARKLVHAEAAVCRLAPVTRSLESLFREISETEREEIKEAESHAA